MLEVHAHVPEAECAVCHRKHGQVMVDRRGNIKYDKKGNEKHVILTINHLDRLCYIDEDEYLTWDPNRMRIECTSCNFFYEKGMVPCPDCLKKGVVTYIRWDQECCDACYYEKHPEILERINQKRREQAATKKQIKESRNTKNRAAKRAHPCSYYGIGQKCRIQYRGASVCPWSKTKAEQCTGFKRKKCAVDVKKASIK
jgi:hypothetical protein